MSERRRAGSVLLLLALLPGIVLPGQKHLVYLLCICCCLWVEGRTSMAHQMPKHCLRPALSCRVTAVGDRWVELDRALPYDLRMQWQVSAARQLGRATVGWQPQLWHLLPWESQCRSRQQARWLWPTVGNVALHLPQPATLLTGKAVDSRHTI